MKLSDESICIVRSSEFAPDPRTERLARFLVESGGRVTLLGLNRSGLSPRRESLDGMEIERLGFLGKSRLPMGDLTISPFIAIWMMWSYLRLIREKPTTVIAADLDAFLPSLFYSLLRRPHLIYNPHDFYADNFRPPTPKSLSSFVRNLERKYVGHADAMILPDISRLGQYPNSKLPLHIVEVVNSPNDSLDHYSSVATTKPCLDAITVLYVGQLARTRGLVHLMNVVDTEQGLHLLLGGQGAHEDQIIMAAKSRRNITFLGRIAHSQVIGLTRECDVIFAMYDPRIPNNLYASPNKLFEAMAFGKPIVVNDGTRLAELVRINDCGVVVKYGDEKGLSASLRELRDNPALRDRLGANGRKAYESGYAWPFMENRLRSFFEAI